MCPSGHGSGAAASEAFYDPRASGVFQANRATIGPWDLALQHGGPPAALLGRTLEAQGGPSGTRIARITFEFFGPVPVAEVSVNAEVLRPGTRIQLSSATMRVAGRIVLRATAWHLFAEAGRTPVVPADFVVPPLPPRETAIHFPGMGQFPYADALEWRFADGDFAVAGPATAWTRCRIPLVQGTVLTGLERILIMVDAANGISAVLPITAWTFVPVDLTVVVERLPDAEWVGMAARTTIGADGIGLTETRLFDADGAFGRALQTLYVAPR